MYTSCGVFTVRGLALTWLVLVLICARTSSAQINPEAFRRTIDGSQVELYTLKNKNGLEATITNYGGIVVSLTVPDKNGKLSDVVLGYDSLNDYIGNNSAYFGALIGRYGNRIAKGRFTINSVDYQLAQNNAQNPAWRSQGFDKSSGKLKRDTPRTGPQTSYE
jgi:aldose 1-epimerase